VKSRLYSPFLRNEKTKVAVFHLQRKRDETPLTLSPSHHRNRNLAEDTLPTFDLKAYARRGAEARIAELTAELNEIFQCRRCGYRWSTDHAARKVH
jgi:hypothetical protein